MSATWQNSDKWRQRYLNFYSKQRLSVPKEENIHRISFMNKVDDKIMKQDMSSFNTEVNTSSCDYDLPNPISRNSSKSLIDYDTALLNMVRSKKVKPATKEEQKNISSSSSNRLAPQKYPNNELCVHGLSLGSPKRSYSISHISKMSTQREFDLPTIMTYSAHVSAPITIKNPEFTLAPKEEENLPQWSIRRSVCPVCSQKWRDRSSIDNVKNSGLKRNSTVELPRVVAPARLCSAIITDYTPRPAVAAVDDEAGIAHGRIHHGKGSWKLARARKFRIKPQTLIELELPHNAAVNDIDLDTRVFRFLTEQTNEINT